ncbi:lon-related putative ATP-dependent protease [Fluviicoccus keumensis]|uniref:endopeptidase La n=1 Tax=Fluviicoccus keumensis TaxID=1435465 RepID=A0A4V2G3I0_9GAMM|nr:ATP-binding protein [Fluviicoccus keumensis]RZU37066.1 lon-related putative ATP-dependent protease [Fluviicoccus keumensis]
MPVKPLTVDQLYKPAHAESLPASTRRTKAFNDFLGQDRAREAVHMALAMPHDGYNIFAVGSNGLGKRTMIKRLLQEMAVDLPPASDWCYLNNFADPRKPIALQLPPGKGALMQKALAKLWRQLSRAILTTFQHEAYQGRVESLKGELTTAQQNALQELANEGEKRGLKLVLRTPGGHGFSPVNDKGEVMNVEEFNTLPPEEQDKRKKAMGDMEERMQKLAEKLGRLEEINRDQVQKLNEEVALATIKPLIQRVHDQFSDLKAFTDYLQAYEQDVVDNIDLILNAQDNEQDAVASVTSDNAIPSRYQINVVVSHNPKKGAPVVFEDLPTHYNLMGHVEQVTYMGTVATDFTLIRAGSLHRANGGFLMLEAEQVLEQPYAWQGLKRALKSRAIKQSSLEQMLTLTGTISLEPDPIPLNLKVVLLGDPETFYLLQEYDPEIQQLFKIRADFAGTMPRSLDNEQRYGHFLADCVAKEKLMPFDRSALMSLIEESARSAEDQFKLSLHAASVGDLLREAHFWAKSEDAKQVTSRHVRLALNGQERRRGQLREYYLEDIAHGTQLLTLDGGVVGQINGLTVIHYADSEFGMPSRITVTVHHGGGDVLDIERTVDMGGPLHAKGVLILSSFLKSRFGRERPLHFSASIAFEQNYGGVDGDSATLAELAALVSAISGIPVQQGIGITGSMNQVGDVQPIGGINAKIEGFFAACKLKGITGKQAVVMPVQNVRNLMLRADVLEAVEQGHFTIYAISRAEEALELLLGMPIGTPDAKGHYPDDSITGRVLKQLKRWHKAERDDGEGGGRKKKKGKKKGKGGDSKAAAE